MIKILLDIVFVFGLLACLAMLAISAAIMGTAVFTIVVGVVKAAHLPGVHHQPRASAPAVADGEFLRNVGIRH